MIYLPIKLFTMKTYYIISLLALVLFSTLLGCSKEDEQSYEELLTRKTWILIEDLAVSESGETLINFVDTFLNNTTNKFYYRYKDDRYIFALNGFFIQEDGVNNDHAKAEHPYGYNKDYQVFQDVDTLGVWSVSQNSLLLSPVNGSKTTHPFKVAQQLIYNIESIDKNYLTISRNGTYNSQSVILRKVYKKYYGMY